MDFDEAIISHKLWREAFLHYLNDNKGSPDMDQMKEHLNIHTNQFGHALKMFKFSYVRLDAEFIEKMITAILGNGCLRWHELHTYYHKYQLK